jgi:hypothetical protein
MYFVVPGARAGPALQSKENPQTDEAADKDHRMKYERLRTRFDSLEKLQPETLDSLSSSSKYAPGSPRSGSG